MSYDLRLARFGLRKFDSAFDSIGVLDAQQHLELYFSPRLMLPVFFKSSRRCARPFANYQISFKNRFNHENFSMKENNLFGKIGHYVPKNYLINKQGSPCRLMFRNTFHNARKLSRFRLYKLKLQYNYDQREAF